MLVFALGGGGDIVSAAAHATWLESRNIRVSLAAIVWERSVVDPCPGPVPLDAITGGSSIGEHALLVYGSCRAIRLCACGGEVFEPQACRVSRILGRPVYIIDAWRGAIGVARGLLEVAGLEGIDAVLGIDVGGDVLAEGIEATLWSPLADSIGLAGLTRTGLDAVMAIHSPSADGELPLSQILERLSDLAAAGGLRAARLISESEARVLEEVVAKGAVTEAGLSQVLARRGVRGLMVLRGGTRRAPLTILQAMIFYVDAYRLACISPLARRVHQSSSLDEARHLLNDAGVYTELDLEEDLYNARCKGIDVDPRVVRERGRRVLLSFLAGRY